MAVIEWDRLCETFCKQEASVALVFPGSSPLLQINGRWRALQVPPISTLELALMTADRIVETSNIAPGYAYSDFWFGKIAFFRLMAIGHPVTTSLVLTLQMP